MKNLPFLYILGLLLVSSFITSCFKDEDQDKRNKEKSEIENYVKVNSLEPTHITSEGLYYFAKKEGTGDALTLTTDYALIKYRGRYLDGTMFDTSDTAEFSQLISGKLPWQKIGGLFKISMGSNFFGLVQGLSLMKEGGKATFIMPSLLSFNDYKPRIYEIDSLKVIHDIFAYERQNYLNAIDTVKTKFLYSKLHKESQDSSSFIFWQGDTTGLYKADKPVLGDSVKVIYSGSILDGRVFEKTLEINYVLGYFQIASFDLALMRMYKGMKAKVYVPFLRAFGNTSGLDKNTGQIVIPAYSNLVYNIELVSFKHK